MKQGSDNKQSVARDVLRRVRSVTSVEGPIALHEPQISDRAKQYVHDCLSSGWVSSVGSFVDRLEKELADFAGVERAVAMVNGTAALHLCLKLAGVSSGDEVLCPALTFVATANAISYCGATPHFIDSETHTLGVDPSKLEKYLQEITVRRGGELQNRYTGKPLRAIIAMHTYGHPVDLDPLVQLCHDYGLTLVEDAAESLGSYYRGTHTGGFGRVAAVSFNGNKVITTGGGGALLTNDVQLAELAKHLSTTAKLPHRWVSAHDMVGFNYRMPNLNAALGCAQLEELPEMLRQKRIVAQRYQQAFCDLADVEFFREPEFATSNYWLNVLMVKEGTGLRDAVLKETNNDRVLTRPVWTLLSKLEMYRDCPAMDLSVAEELEQRIVNLPSSASLAEAAHLRAAPAA